MYSVSTLSCICKQFFLRRRIWAPSLKLLVSIFISHTRKLTWACWAASSTHSSLLLMFLYIQTLQSKTKTKNISYPLQILSILPQSNLPVSSLYEEPLSQRRLFQILERTWKHKDIQFMMHASLFQDKVRTGSWRFQQRANKQMICYRVWFDSIREGWGIGRGFDTHRFLWWYS